MIHLAEIEVGAAVVAIGGTVAVAGHARAHVRTHGLYRTLFRTACGRALNGQHTTNATFLSRSDGTTRTVRGRASKRHHRAGIHNLTISAGYTAAGLGTLYGLGTDPSATVPTAAAAAGLLAAWKTYRGITAARAAYSRRRHVSPMAHALAEVLQVSGAEAATMIQLVPNYAKVRDGSLGKINLPVKLAVTPDELAGIGHIVKTRLPVDVELSPRLMGRSPHIALTAVPPLPSLVPVADWLPQIEALGPRKYIAGIKRSGEPLIAAFGGDEPHHGFGWSSGRGKSTMLKSILGQTLGNEPGAEAYVMDPKDLSLQSMAGVPGITWFGGSGDIPGMWSGFTAARKEMQARYERMKADPTYEPPSLYVIGEEMNSLAVMSSIAWRQMKEKGDPATPPFWAEDVAPILWRGRQANVFMIVVAQSLQERFLGGLNLRPSLGTLSLAGYKVSQWKTAVGTFPVPKVQKGRGRHITIVAEDEIWSQSLYGTDQEYRDLAMRGRRISQNLVNVSDHFAKGAK